MAEANICGVGCRIRNPPSELLEERLQRLGGLLQLLLEGGVRLLLALCFRLNIATKTSVKKTEKRQKMRMVEGVALNLVSPQR